MMLFVFVRSEPAKIFACELAGLGSILWPGAGRKKYPAQGETQLQEVPYSARMNTVLLYCEASSVE